MIDPTKITDYDRSEEQLEELLLFCIAVAGKNATTTSLNLERMLDYGKDFSSGTPFQIVKAIEKRDGLSKTMKAFGFGCYNIKSKGFLQAADAGLDLKTCTVESLEEIHGVGMKTARFFVLHTRRNAKVACLDTHVLKWLSYYSGHTVPKQTPTRKRYLELERAFLAISEAMNIAPADLDLKIWNKSRGSDEESLAKAA